MKIITFLSDFGRDDWFIAAVKGEILKVYKNVRIIDITHTISPHDIRGAAFILKCIYRSFPLGTTHLAVVDPGVGSTRKPIIVASDGYYFVGPDNGMFSYIYNSASVVYAIRTTNGLSSTFHARDIFGPTAARLARGAKPSRVGRRIRTFERFPFPKARVQGKKAYGEILYCDRFGNLITSIPNTMDIRFFSVAKKRIPKKKYYSEGRRLEPIAVRGSCGYYEIACNRANARAVLSARIGSSVTALLD